MTAFRRRGSRCRIWPAWNVSRVDLGRVRPEEPHWSLVVMLVLTQLSVGAVAMIWLLGLLGRELSRTTVLAPAIVTAVALAAVTFHLGRPIIRVARAEGVETFVAEPRSARAGSCSPALAQAVMHGPSLRSGTAPCGVARRTGRGDRRLPVLPARQESIWFRRGRHGTSTTRMIEFLLSCRGARAEIGACVGRCNGRLGGRIWRSLRRAAQFG